jgi:Ca2+-binding EF-hand superfamily protein
VAQQINRGISKKKVMSFFKTLDTSNNGSISTEKLIKLWLEGKSNTDPAEILFKLLSRHMKEIQSEQFITKFNIFSYQ